MSTQQPRILAYTVSHGDRTHLADTIKDMRGSAGIWFDWLVCLGAPSESLKDQATEALNHPQKRGIQYLKVWSQNRGQHHATVEALRLAQEQGYQWLLRIDDDLQSKTKRWLKKMIDYSEKLREAVKDDKRRIISAPKIVGLNNPLHPIGVLEIDNINFKAEAMEILGGACRLHPVSFLKDFAPNVYAPINRQDPQQIAKYVMEKEGIMIRFPQIRMVHRTDELEAQDTEEQAINRILAQYWPYLGETA